MKFRVGCVIALTACVVALSGCRYVGVLVPCSVPKEVNQSELIGVWSLDYSFTFPRHWVTDPVEGSVEYITFPRQWVTDPVDGSVVYTDKYSYLVRPDGTSEPLGNCAYIDPLDIWEECSKLRGQGYPMVGKERIRLSEDGTFQQTFNSRNYSYVGPIQKWELITSTPDGPKLRMDGMKFFAAGIAQANCNIPVELGPQLSDILRLRESVTDADEVNAAVVYPDDGYLYLYPRVCNGRLTLVQMAFGRLGFDEYYPNAPWFIRSGK